jgi:hypothetical protein
MKKNKALKRLAKIEAMMSDVAKRFSAHAPSLQEAFADLKAAVDRVKEAVGVQASSAAGKKKAASGRRKAAKKVAEKAPMAKLAKKRAPVKKIAKRTAVKKPARVARKAAAASAARDSMPAPIAVE